MKHFLDEYTLHARLIPTVLGIVPFVIIFNLLPVDSTVLKVFFTGIFSIAITYFVMQFLIRLPAKIFEDFLFSNGLKMPTTELLLYKNDEYQSEFKNNVRDKILNDFNIKMPTKKMEEDNELESRKKIKDSVKLMISRVKNGYLLFKHNYEYGFFRNLWSASLFGLIGSVLLAYLSNINNYSTLLTVSIILMAIYFLYLIFGFLIIKYAGKQYAKKLIEEYYEQKFDEKSKK